MTVEFKQVAPWEAAFDMPHNSEQALAVLRAWSREGCLTFSHGRCARAYECLSNERPRKINPQIAYGRHLDGWAFGVEDGWFGGYHCEQEAINAGLQYMREVQP